MTEYSSSSVAVVAALLAVCLAAAWNRRKPKAYPPGPRPFPLPIPFLGRFPSVALPTSLPWLVYTEWGKRFGPLIHFEAFNQHVLIVNSLEVAHDLFEKRPHIYSSRPWMPILELSGFEGAFSGKPYGDQWRMHRRLFDKHFRRESSRSYRPVQVQKIHDFLRKLNENPQDFSAHVRALPGSVIMSVVYGYNVADYSQDRFIEIAEEYNLRLTNSFIPGAMPLLDFFPAVRHLPKWFPGCGFHRVAQELLALKEEVVHKPFGYAVDNKDSGRSDPVPVVVKMVEEAETSDDEEFDMMKEVTAASDTTVSAIMTFFLVMALYPAVQRKAQMEIDSLLGLSEPGSAIPTFEQKGSLPYIEAIFREVLRWRPILPLSLPHATSTEDAYNGYYIPKGATAILNVWPMTREESTYGTNTEDFNPDRFLDVDGTLLEVNHSPLSFGLGPRICPGRFFAEDTFWMTIVSVLALFNVSNATTTNPQGLEVEVDAKNPPYSDNPISHPLPFNCSILPRSTAALDLLKGISRQE
uniref:Cytochrome P450 n=1 Tax=Mycena chlorophos TaxID=658473 RepID=A0ABQ0LPI6_MYCCL|nr:cytochrome P450 [Mycena chlorophos]